MDNALGIALHGLRNGEIRLEAISRNLANVSTPGYRRETVVSRPFAQLVAGAAHGAPLATELPHLATEIDRRAGSHKATAEPLHVAIEGEGYFEVATAAGPAYTRQGRFQLDARGRLVTEAGDAVMGRSGEIVIAGANPAIDRQGVVTDNGRVVGQLKTVRFAPGDRLERLGAGLLRQASGAAPAPGEAPLRQGFLENSNVNAAAEMVRLVETLRQFESHQKLVQACDEMLEKALRKLGDL